MDLKNIILNNVKEAIILRKNVTDEEINSIIKSQVIRESEKKYMTPDIKRKIEEEVYYEIKGYGIIQPLIDNKDVSEIMINGNDTVFVEKNGIIENTNLAFKGKELENLIQKIVGRMNRSVNKSTPIVDARLRDGSRINIVLDPIALNGPILTIRKFSESLIDIDRLVENNTLDSEVADFLKYLVEKKYNVFISGGTSSGKTTLLNVLSNFIGESERVITIEDSAELKINKIKNLVRLETRNKNSEGHGEITMKDLIKSSLRMRPDRIIVGEVRGAEAYDMLQAMNTGHDGSLSTGHANTGRDMLVRLETMILMEYDVPLESIKRQIASAIDIIVHVNKKSNGLRVVEEIIEINGLKEGEYEINELYKYDHFKEKITRVSKLKKQK